jgi:hypothetical protein
MKIHIHISQQDLGHLGALLEFPEFNENAVVVPVRGEKYTPGKSLWFERVVGELKVVVTIEPGRTQAGEKVIHVNAYTLFAEGCPYCGHPLKAGEPCGNCGAW